MKPTRFFAIIVALCAAFFFVPSASAEELGGGGGAGGTGESGGGQPKPAHGGAAEKPAARREDVEPKTLADAKDALKTARGDRDKAEKDLVDEKAAHDATKKELATANETAGKVAALEKERDDAVTARDGATKARDEFVSKLKAGLQLTDAQVGALNGGDSSVIAVAVTELAARKAVELAAAQGVPPVTQTKPGAEQKTMKRAVFDKLEPAEQNAFMRGGGKLED